ncbi:MAG: chaperonin GroEL, partial [Anaerolineae bacterium]|nr:chaperonin GroEL [Anaerolineae bacterium]
AGTVARRIIGLPDRVEDMGAMLMRHMTWRMRDEIGDGSATAAVIARVIAREAHRMAVAGANPMLLKRGIEKATAAVVQALEEMSEPLEGEEEIAAVATASIGDAEIGKILGEMYDILGPNANIVIVPYIATFHDRAYHEGARFEGGYLSPYFITDTARRVAVLEDVYVLVGDLTFREPQDVQGILEKVRRAGGKSLFIACRMMYDAAIGVLVANNEKGTIRSCAANIKPVGDLRRGTIENIAILTGGHPLTDKAGIAFEDISLEDLGRADRVIVTREHYTIVGGKGDRQVIRERVKQLRQRLRSTTDSEERDTYRALVKHFSAGVGELRIGGLTEEEREVLTQLAEQAMRTVSAAMEGGIVPGGGAAYLAAIPALEDVEAEGDEALGVRIIARALEEPMRCIAENVGVHPPLVIAEARKAGPGYGFDAIRKKVVNMREAGIMDPTLVIRRALQQAVSGALMLLTTDALVLHRKPEESFQP